MRFKSTQLRDAWLIESDKHSDDRGFFARLRCCRKFESAGIPSDFVQTSLSFNAQRGTFRGLHYQIPPSNEGKLVRCVSGRIFDVIVDLRPNSASFLQHQWFELNAESVSALWVPSGFAHGFITSDENTRVLYEMTDYYAPELGRGIRWDDPSLSLMLPFEIENIHPRDAAYDDLDVTKLACFRAPVSSEKGAK